MTPSSSAMEWFVLCSVHDKRTESAESPKTKNGDQR